MRTTMFTPPTALDRCRASAVAVVVLLAVLVAACGAAQPDALAVGDRSISRNGLNDLVLTVNNVDPEQDDLPSAVAAAEVQRVGTIWLQLAAAGQYLESNGVIFDETAREAAKQRVEEAISGGTLGAADRDGEAFEALMLSEWINASGDQINTPEAVDAMRSLLTGADVDSRLGSWNAELSAIEPA